jgi:EAL domain-containing protein (putative c-di-GMP-specific phosphodiesterase class I)/GGDEF domain-containing protein
MFENNSKLAADNYSGLPTFQEQTSKETAQQPLSYPDWSLGLLDRQQCITRMQQICLMLEHNPSACFSLLLIKIDRLRVLRYSLEDKIIDELLVAFADRLQRNLAPSMVGAHLREDEFAVLLEFSPIDQDNILTYAENLQSKLRSPFNIFGFEIFLNIHIGITNSQISKCQPTNLLNDAGLAAFIAQQASKDNHCALFNPQIRNQVTERLHLENDLRIGISRQEFILHYQPIYELESNSLIGFEALVRWQHPTRGLISPATFIPIAEETGSIIPLGWWVLREACRQLKHWQNLFPTLRDLTMSVNLSSQQFSQPNLFEQVNQILYETGLEARNLKLEITETVLMDNVESAAVRLRHLQARGVKLSIDDFGTGYSSLSYLQKFPVNTLKIDRSFIQQLETDSKSACLAQAIILLANSLGMDVVSEGIETSEQYWQMKALQCEYGQGFFWSRPLDVAAMEYLLWEEHRQLLTLPLA